jgi:hypothetical protein
MTRLTRLCRALGVGLAVAAATLSMTQVAHAAPVRSTIAPPPGQKVFLVAKVSTGVQIYRCDGKAWVFDHPEATLVGNGKEIIQHSAGPTWQAKDGSSVMAKKVAEAPAPTGDAIPWLKLEATETAAGTSGGDRLAHTTFIQRINTAGGLAPKGDCDPAATPEARISYTADYVFWTSTAGG